MPSRQQARFIHHGCLAGKTELVDALLSGPGRTIDAAAWLAVRCGGPWVDDVGECVIACVCVMVVGAVNDDHLP